jgi:hypothetical protein
MPWCSCIRRWIHDKLLVLGVKAQLWLHDWTPAFSLRHRFYNKPQHIVTDEPSRRKISIVWRYRFLGFLLLIGLLHSSLLVSIIFHFHPKPRQLAEIGAQDHSPASSSFHITNLNLAPTQWRTSAFFAAAFLLERNAWCTGSGDGAYSITTTEPWLL